MKLSKREKILLIVVTIILCAVAYFFLYFQPTMDEINTLNSQNINDQSTINSNLLLKSRLDAAIQGISESEAMLAEFSDKITSAFDQPDVLVYLYRTMNDYGTKIMISFNGSGDLGHIKYCNIQVSMNCTYEGLKGILKEFVNSEYIIKVTQLTALNAPELGGTDTASGEGETDDGSFADNFETPITETDDNLLSIGMTIEIYNTGDEIPPDRPYDFTDGAVQYGGDIFH